MTRDRISHMRFKAEMERRVIESTRRFSDPRERDRRIWQEGYGAGWMQQCSISYRNNKYKQTTKKDSL